MSSPFVHYLYMCSVCPYSVVHIRVYIHNVMEMCSGSSLASYLDTVIKCDWTSFFFGSYIYRVTVCQ